MEKIGIINEEGYVKSNDGLMYPLPVRGAKEGYLEVIIDAKAVGGSGWMHRQSIKPYIGMKCKFQVIVEPHGFNFEIIKE